MGNENNTKIVLSTLRYKSSPIVDNMVDIGLSQTSKESVEFDRSNTIDLAQVFENERQASTTFRPVTKITYLFKNTYYGHTDYKPFTENLAPIVPTVFPVATHIFPFHVNVLLPFIASPNG